MKNDRKKIISLILLFVLSFSSGLILLKADKIVKADFAIEKETIFENFLLNDDDTNNVIYNPNNIDIGEKPYLEITRDEENFTSTSNNWLYVQYLNTKAFYQDYSGDNVIIIRMRGSNVFLNNLQLRIGINEDYRVKEYQPSPLKDFDTLKDTDGNKLQNLTQDYQDFVIDISKSFADSDVYKSVYSYITETKKVNENPVCSIEINAKKGISDNFVLDIDSIYTCKKENYLSSENYNVWNEFLGDTNYIVTANNDSTYIAPNANGISGQIIRREIKMNPDSSFEVAHSDGKDGLISYTGKYLCVEAKGDTDNLLVYVMNENGIYSEAITYKDYILINRIICSVKLEYTGEESVYISEIYMTAYSEEDIVTNVPLIAYAEDGYISLDKFTAAQDIFYQKNEDAMLRQSNIFRQINARYRYSTNYKDNNYPEISNSVLKFNATRNINYSSVCNFSALYDVSSKNYKYIVLKARFAGLANINNLSFCFDESQIGNSANFIRYTDLYCGYGMKSTLPDSTNPYNFGGGYYFLIIDMEQSGIRKENTTFISLNYNGQGEVYIDEIFLTNEKTSVVVNENLLDNTNDIAFESGTTEKTINLDTSNYNYLEFKVRLSSNMKENESGTVRNKFKSVIFKFDDTPYTLNQLYTNVNILLSNIFTENMVITTPTTVILDLNKCGIKNTKTLTIEFAEEGSFTISSFRLIQEVKYIDYKTVTQTKKISDSLPISDTYELNYQAGSENVVLQMKLECDTSDLSDIEFDFDGRKFYADDSENAIILVNNVYLKDIKFNSSLIINVDLSLMGIDSAQNFTINILKNDSALNKLKITNLYFGKYESVYNYIIGLSNAESQKEEEIDTDFPVISLIWTASSTKEQYLKVPLSYTDQHTTDINNLTVIIEVKKVKDESNKTVNEIIEYTLEDETIETVQNAPKYSCNICFEATAGNYEINVTVLDKAENSTSKNVKIKVIKDQQIQPIKKFNWKIVIYIVISILGIAALVVGVIFIIKLIKGKDNHINFS